MTSINVNPVSVDMPRRLEEFAARFDPKFDALLTPADEVPHQLVAAVRYSALAPGKRIRPYLVVRCCELVGGDVARAWPAAAAVECVHAFSLIHDDLPAMDDDDMRRGQPSCHKKFGEAVAILAGDALIVFAFELLSRHIDDHELAAGMILELAHGAGWAGMIGGQAADMLGVFEPPSLERIRSIHERKTARLFEAACRIGAMAGGGNLQAAETLASFGQFLGRAFQIADDLLDLSGRPDRAGKPVGQDAHADKQGFPRCVGVERSRAAATEALEAARAKLRPFDAKADDLRALAAYVVQRDY